EETQLDISRWEALQPVTGWAHHPDLRPQQLGSNFEVGCPAGRITTLDETVDPIDQLSPDIDSPASNPEYTPPTELPEDDGTVDTAEEQVTNTTEPSEQSMHGNNAQGHLWERASLLENSPGRTTETPDLISKSAAYEAPPAAADQLGQLFERTIGTIERFYCMAHTDALEDRPRCMGRGQGYQLKEVENKERGVETEGANSWKDWKKAARALAYAMPEMKGRVTPTAEQEKYAAVKRDYRESTRLFCQWLADTEAKPGVLHSITKPPVRREEEIATAANITDCPIEIAGMVEEALSKRWSCSELPHEQRTAILKRLRMQALCTGYSAWTVEDLDAALKGEPDRGQRTDELNCSDIRRLPLEGRQ
ncbi:unnamed protein product, partial [Prorocentrum cordatum]